MDGFLQSAQRLMDTHLFNLGNTKLTVGTLVAALGTLVVAWIVSRGIRKAIDAGFRRRGVSSPGTVAVVARLAHYTVMFVGFGVALQTAGVDLDALFAAGAVFAVGLGFALQNIVQNFVSGVILLVERAIKPGDILTVEDRVVQVEEMGIRAAIVRTRDGQELIVPNSVIVQSTVINATLRDSMARVRVGVGVTYSSDMVAVRRTLEAVGNATARRWGIDPRVQVIMTGFGDSSVNWELAVWHRDPWRERELRSELHEAIWRGFQEAGIVIAFPQLDLHLDPPVASGLARLAAVPTR